MIATVYSIGLLGGRAFAAVDERCNNSFLGFPAWYAYLDVEYVDDKKGCKIVGPAKTETDASGETISSVDVAKAAPMVFLAVIDILMRLAGMIAFAYVVISGFKFVLSQGNPEKEKAARQTIINALIGLVISILAIGLTTGLGRFLAS